MSESQMNDGKTPAELELVKLERWDGMEESDDHWLVGGRFHVRSRVVETSLVAEDDDLERWLITCAWADADGFVRKDAKGAHVVERDPRERMGATGHLVTVTPNGRDLNLPLLTDARLRAELEPIVEEQVRRYCNTILRQERRLALAEKTT